MKTFGYILALLIAESAAYFYFKPQAFDTLLYAAGDVIKAVAQFYPKK